MPVLALVVAATAAARAAASLGRGPAQPQGAPGGQRSARSRRRLGTARTCALSWHRSDVCIFPTARTIEEHP
eukprot:623713-Pyramimonas_sp.AAC.1